MKKTKSIAIIIIIVLLSVFLSGCWNYRDINELNLVTGFAVDRSEDGHKYLITVELADVQSQGKESKVASKIIQTEGLTILDAIRNMIKISGRKLYFSHAKVVIISQDVAREGVTQVVDLLARDSEPRLEINLIVSKEKSAKELLEYESIGENLHCIGMYEILKSQRNLSKAPFIENYKFIQALYSEEESAILPVANIVQSKGQKSVEIQGTAIFKKDKLVGFLDANDTKYLLFIRNMVKSCVLSEIEKGENKGCGISLEVFENKSKIIPRYIDGKVSIDINMKTVVGIDEHSNTGNFIDEKGRNILKNEAEKSIEANIIHVIKKAQTQYDADVFEFGRMIKIKMPSVWKSISTNWDDIYRNINVNVNEEVEIRSSGFLEKPIYKGD